MSVNKYKPHLFVLPEDDANINLANGFHLGVDLIRQMQVLSAAGGWNAALERFKSEHVKGMDEWPERFIVLLIDFDGRENRLEIAKAAIPEHLADRVFVLGVLSRPEELKAILGAYEEIGLAMADDCRRGTDSTWGHALLKHNASELERLRVSVRSILF